MGDAACKHLAKLVTYHGTLLVDPELVKLLVELVKVELVKVELVKSLLYVSGGWGRGEGEEEGRGEENEVI